MACSLVKCNILLHCSRLSMVGMDPHNNNRHIQENRKMSAVCCNSKAYWCRAYNILRHCSRSIQGDKDLPCYNKCNWDSHKNSSHL